MTAAGPAGRAAATMCVPRCGGADEDVIDPRPD